MSLLLLLLSLRSRLIPWWWRRECRHLWRSIWYTNCKGRVWWSRAKGEELNASLQKPLRGRRKFLMMLQQRIFHRMVAKRKKKFRLLRRVKNKARWIKVRTNSMKYTIHSENNIASSKPYLRSSSSISFNCCSYIHFIASLCQICIEEVAKRGGDSLF